MLVGYKWVEWLMPPVITGAIVMVIGLNLAHIAVSEMGGVPSWYRGHQRRLLRDSWAA